MSPTSARVATVRTATRPSPDRRTEDRVFTTKNAVVVLDGSSRHPGADGDGGWMADTLGHEIRRRLSERDDGLAQVLADAIADVAQRYGLVPGESPSATVSIVRWARDTVDVLVLGDSPVVALARDGEIRQVRDERLRHVVGHQRRALHDQLSPADVERAQRNRPSGYWIAEAVPEAAAHSVRTRWRRDDLDAILVMTDGVSAGVDRYGVPADWNAAFAIAKRDPNALIDLVHNAEDSDPDGMRWPRSRRHDDKTVAVIRFNLS
jgi:Protein phosphatase 2C